MKMKIIIMNENEIQIGNCIMSSENIDQESVKKLIKALIEEDYDDIEVIKKEGIGPEAFSANLADIIRRSFDTVKGN